MSAKVRFNENVKIHHMVAWTFAYNAARKGKWLQIACDRARFKHKIEFFFDLLLKPILESKINYIYMQNNNN